METSNLTSTGSKKAVWAVAIILVIIAVALIIIFNPFQKTEEFNPSFIYFENAMVNSYKGEIMGTGISLENTGYVTANLEKGEYALYYDIMPCANPSEKLFYTFIDANGAEVSYNPLIDKIITNAQGKQEKVAMTEGEKVQAVLNEKIYILETENTEPVHNLAVLYEGALNFKADEQVKFSYKAKCDGSKVALSLYRMA